MHHEKFKNVDFTCNSENVITLLLLEYNLNINIHLLDKINRSI